MVCLENDFLGECSILANAFLGIDPFWQIDSVKRLSGKCHTTSLLLHHYNPNTLSGAKFLAQIHKTLPGSTSSTTSKVVQIIQIKRYSDDHKAPPHQDSCTSGPTLKLVHAPKILQLSLRIPCGVTSFMRPIQTRCGIVFGHIASSN